MIVACSYQDLNLGPPACRAGALGRAELQEPDYLQGVFRIGFPHAQRRLEAGGAGQPHCDDGQGVEVAHRIHPPDEGGESPDQHDHQNYRPDDHPESATAEHSRHLTRLEEGPWREPDLNR